MGKAWKEDTDGRHQVDEARLALVILAQHTGEQAGALLVIVQALTRNNLISAEESQRLVSLLLPEPPAPQNSVTAAVIAHDKRRRSRACKPIDPPIGP